MALPLLAYPIRQGKLFNLVCKDLVSDLVTEFSPHTCYSQQTQTQKQHGGGFRHLHIPADGVIAAGAGTPDEIPVVDESQIR